MKSFDTYVENGKRCFAAVFGPGKGGQHFVAGLDFKEFVDKWIELGKKKADMITFRVYAEGGKMRFAGLFGPPAKGGQHFVAGLGFKEFVDKWAELGKKKADMITFYKYEEGGKARFAGLFGPPGKGGQEFYSGLDFDALALKWVTAKEEGRRLISVVVG
jgi:hypothetical protein